MPLAAFPKCYLNVLVDEEMSIEEWLDIAARLDIDGVEFYWGITPDDDIERLDRIRTAAADRGLAIPMMCYSPDFTHPDPEVRKEEIEREKRAIRTTARLGGDYCRVLSGQRRPEVSHEEGITWVSECIETLIPFAAAHEVTLILENHYKDDFWEFPEFAQDMETFLTLLDRIDESRWVGVNYDPSNAIIADDDPYELLEAVKHRVVTMHASDRYLEGGTLDDLRKLDEDARTGYADILQHGVVGEGMIDYDCVFSMLSDAGFDGWISIEDGTDQTVGEKHLAESAEFLRTKMDRYGLN